MSNNKLDNDNGMKAADNFDTGIEFPPGEIRISVRGLVEFILRQGDIDNRHQVSADNAMQEGSRIHRMLQKRMGAEYQAEVSLKYTLETRGYTLIVEGRADGIITREGQVTVDEIKGTYRDLHRMNSPMLLHVAQAKCYAYMYALREELSAISVQMTYCNMETEDIRYFYEDYSFEELAEWFNALISEYRRWADYSMRWRGIRQTSIEGLPFPFPYREGQKELATNVYRTIYHKKKLFLEAPTGVGKTISTVYPAVQAMGKGMGDRLFYLTAKTITRTVAEEALNSLRQKGLRIKSVILTAKEKLCFMDEAECNPEACPYAKGHYDRINDAVYDLLTSEEAFTREIIETYALKHQVCPFEMCLDMSLFSDAIICDYNYLFDPHVYLKRFFGDGTEGNYIFLIDEAHNLLERGREMYSAVLWKEQFMELRREVKQTILSEINKKSSKYSISDQLTFELTNEMTEMSDEETNITTVTESISPSRSGKSVLVSEGYADKMIYQLEKCNSELLNWKRECEGCRVVENMDGFMKHLMRLHATMDEYLSEQESGLAVREMILKFYFEVSHFLQMYELVDENYVKYTQVGEDGSFLIKLFCVNPRENLKKCMLRGRSSILFSATFLPIQYYKKLLGGDDKDYEVYAKSIFNQKKRALLIANDVTSKYTRRSEDEYYNIARYIEEIVKNRHGNYMVFCPSYAFMRIIYEKYIENFEGLERQCMIQGESMSEADREAFLAKFQGESTDLEIGEVMDDILDGDAIPSNSRGDRCLIGFCVLGGIFSEGIDLKNDRLIGAIIVGTGLPQVCNEREILKSYFDENGENGFDYSYRYPGMNKVLQSAGRVIRTVEDVGIIALLDERFLQFAYRKMFPLEWERFETVTVGTVAKQVERFWDEWT